MDLAEFLLAQIANDEAVARDADPLDWDVSDGATHASWLFVDHWNPAHVLAECEAKRRIVELHETIRAAYPGTTIETDPCCVTCSAGGEYPGEFPCATLRLLAAPYAGHHDYRSEWEPLARV